MVFTSAVVLATITLGVASTLAAPIGDFDRRKSGDELFAISQSVATNLVAPASAAPVFSPAHARRGFEDGLEILAREGSNLFARGASRGMLLHRRQFDELD